jgi:DNA-binding response OmpR family regulator
LESAQAAIEEGVDGYLLKPVEAGEVRQAVQNALERRERLAESRARVEAERAVLQQGPFFVDRRRLVATFQGEPLDLTESEFRLLSHLVANADRVISPPELVRVVRDYDPHDLREARDMIKWYIYRLRQKVEPEPSEPRYILNVRGVGYRFGEASDRP